MNGKFQNILYAASFSLLGATALNLPRNASAAATVEASQAVSYADLDLSKPAAAKVLYRRIDLAAHRVCSIEGYKDLGEPARQQSCIKRAIDMAIADVNSPVLSQLHGVRVIRLAGM